MRTSAGGTSTAPGTRVAADSGSATVLVVVTAAVLVLVLGALLSVGAIGVAHRRADTAADLTALAAALDGPSCGRGSELATANGARLIGCNPGMSGDVTVRVAVDVRLPRPGGAVTVVGSARAGRTTVPLGPVSGRADAP